MADIIKEAKMNETKSYFQSFLASSNTTFGDLKKIDKILEKLQIYKSEDINIEEEHEIYISTVDKILLGNQKASLDVNIILICFFSFCVFFVCL
jgi:NH3-dependent NAD+ synthetase